jgi:subtilisin-like proprotein convertase family protein
MQNLIRTARIVAAMAWLAAFAGGSVGAGHAQSLPSVQFTVAEQTVAEAVGAVSVTATLSAASAGTVRAPYRVQGSAGSADHNLVNGTLVFSPGVTSRALNFSVVNDALDEAQETVVIRLNTPNGATLGTTVTHTVRIQDDDPLPVVAVLPAAAREGEVTALPVTLQLNTVSGRNVRVDVFTLDETARVDQDYGYMYERVTIAAGELTRTVSIPLLNDTIDEPDETIRLFLSNPVAVSPGAASRATIIDEDPMPAVQFQTASLVVGEGRGPLAVGVGLSALSAFTITVTPATTNGSAQAGSDFAALAGPLTFAPMQSLVTLTLPLLDEAAWEINETFGLTLGAPVNAVVGARASVSITIANDDPRPGCMIAANRTLNLTIPDNAPAGVETPLEVVGQGFSVSDVSVRLEELQHPYIADLRVWLIAPNGVSVQMLNNVGSGADLRYTVFNDNAPTLQGASPPFTGTFRPNTALPALGQLIGLPADGVWRLRVADTAAGDTGRVAAWGLELCGAAIPPTGGARVMLPLINR